MTQAKMSIDELTQRSMARVNRAVDEVVSVYRWNRFFRALFMCAAITATAYSFFWDIRFDWGLLERGPEFPLRSKSVFNYDPVVKKRFYYSAIVINFLLRCAWVDTLIPSSLGFNLLRDDLVIFMIMIFEISRRMLWNFIRLENEHLNNVGEFRALNIIIPDLPPIASHPKLRENQKSVTRKKNKNKKKRKN